MRLLSAIIIVILGLSGCKENPEVDADSEYASLKDNQTRFKLRVEDKDFYEYDAIFEGNIDVRKNYLALNCFNQYGGNFMVTLDGDLWYKKVSIEGRGGSNFSSVMFGKVIDKINNKGIGYLLSKGTIEPITVSRSKLVFRVNGIAKRYPYVNVEDPSYNFEGYVISKNPKFLQYTIPE